MAQINRVFLFNGVDIQKAVPYLTVYAIDMYSEDRVINAFPIARRNAQAIASAWYQDRKIYIGVYINAPSRAAADVAVDQLMTFLQPIEGSLVVEQSGSVRQYTATYEKLSKNTSGVGRGNVAPPEGGLTDFSIVFGCSDSFGYDTNYTVIQPATSYTSGNVANQFTQGGSALTQVPILQFKITAVSANSTDSITVGNQNTGQQIVVNRAWSVNDTLVINTQTKSVQVNGADVPFTGAFPEFQPSYVNGQVVGGAQTYYYLDTFNTRTVQHFVYVYNRWV